MERLPDLAKASAGVSNPVAVRIGRRMVGTLASIGLIGWLTMGSAGAIMAVAAVGELPDPIQQIVADVVEVVGIDLPDPEEDRSVVDRELVDADLIPNGDRNSAPSSTTPGDSGGQGSSSNGTPGSAPGQSGNAPGQGGSCPGNSCDAPGQGGSSPGNSGNAPGQGGSSPGNSGNAPGQGGSSPGNSGNAPGLGGSSPGNSGNAVRRGSNGFLSVPENVQGRAEAGVR